MEAIHRELAGVLELMEKSFHGSVGCVSVLEEVTEDKGDCVALHEECELENNREGNSLRTNGKMPERVEGDLACHGKRFIVHKQDFEQKVLAQHHEKSLKGRKMIDERAQDVVANYKHDALRFHTECCVANQETPS